MLVMIKITYNDMDGGGEIFLVFFSYHEIANTLFHLSLLLDTFWTIGLVLLRAKQFMLIYLLMLSRHTTRGVERNKMLGGQIKYHNAIQ